MRTPKSSTIVSRAVSRDIPAEMSDARRAALERMRAARLEPRKNVAIQNCTNWSHTKTGEGDTSCAEQYVVPDQQTRYFKFQSLKTTRHALFFFRFLILNYPGLVFWVFTFWSFQEAKKIIEKAECCGAHGLVHLIGNWWHNAGEWYAWNLSSSAMDLLYLIVFICIQTGVKLGETRFVFKLC